MGARVRPRAATLRWLSVPYLLVFPFFCLVVLFLGKSVGTTGEEVLATPADEAGVTDVAPVGQCDTRAPRSASLAEAEALGIAAGETAALGRRPRASVIVVATASGVLSRPAERPSGEAAAPPRRRITPPLWPSATQIGDAVATGALALPRLLLGVGWLGWLAVPPRRRGCVDDGEVAPGDRAATGATRASHGAVPAG